MERSKSFEERWLRILACTGANSDSALARILDILPQSVTAARKREQIPSGWIESISEKFNISADWLFFGRGPMRPGAAPSAPPEQQGDRGSKRHVRQAPPLPEGACVRMEVLFEVAETLEEILQERNKVMNPTVKAEVLCQLCQLVIDNESEKVRPAQMFRLIKGALAANE